VLLFRKAVVPEFATLFETTAISNIEVAMPDLIVPNIHISSAFTSVALQKACQDGAT
jgi:hypothetical protein